nr:helix-turn-helix domain-containing protein [Flavonifractor plautii]
MIFLRNAHAPSILLSRRCMTVDAKTRQAIQDILAANCELLTIPETAARLRVNKNTVYDLIKKGYLKSIKLGCRKVSVRALAEFIERCESGEIEL